MHHLTSAQIQCSDRIAEEKEEAALPCICEEETTHSRPGVTTVSSIACEGVVIQWYNEYDIIGSCWNGEIVINEPYKEVMTIDSDERLIIFEAGMDNVGLYTCQRHDGGSSIGYISPLVIHGKWSSIGKNNKITGFKMDDMDDVFASLTGTLFLNIL